MKVSTLEQIYNFLSNLQYDIQLYFYPPEVETFLKWFPTGSQFDVFLSYISLEESFLTFKLPLEIGFFETSYFFIAWMVDGGWMGHGSHFGCQKKHPFRKYLENYSIFFPDCFWSPQKSFEDIFWNVPNWKNRKFFQ